MNQIQELAASVLQRQLEHYQEVLLCFQSEKLQIETLQRLDSGRVPEEGSRIWKELYCTVEKYQKKIKETREALTQVAGVKRIDVKQCQRCGHDHDSMLFYPLANPADPELAHYSMCPTLNQPLMLRIVPDAGEVK